jgi:hypothetical protein
MFSWLSSFIGETSGCNTPQKSIRRPKVESVITKSSQVTTTSVSAPIPEPAPVSTPEPAPVSIPNNGSSKLSASATTFIPPVYTDSSIPTSLQSNEDNILSNEELARINPAFAAALQAGYDEEEDAYDGDLEQQELEAYFEDFTN